MEQTGVILPGVQDWANGVFGIQPFSNLCSYLSTFSVVTLSLSPTPHVVRVLSSFAATVSSAAWSPFRRGVLAVGESQFDTYEIRRLPPEMTEMAAKYKTVRFPGLGKRILCLSCWAIVILLAAAAVAVGVVALRCTYALYSLDAATYDLVLGSPIQMAGMTIDISIPVGDISVVTDDTISSAYMHPSWQAGSSSAFSGMEVTNSYSAIYRTYSITGTDLESLSATSNGHLGHITLADSTIDDVTITTESGRFRSVDVYGCTMEELEMQTQYDTVRFYNNYVSDSGSITVVGGATAVSIASDVQTSLDLNASVADNARNRMSLSLTSDDSSNVWKSNVCTSSLVYTIWGDTEVDGLDTTSDEYAALIAADMEEDDLDGFQCTYHGDGDTSTPTLVVDVQGGGLEVTVATTLPEWSD
ncbi:hypothetical protein KIPB_005573 [Kipferlia bialata]|uniref:Uncharacterized protein n=1 Tax=Kipferlia bialata TaxID=797122 RepID=A0A9K3GJ58_9EUKA|nr:hypothetical protein KIPB_005573 [Kipferlia bialata]|eukprot:g5573.t1